VFRSTKNVVITIVVVVVEVVEVVDLETGLDDFVSLESGDHDVEDPEEDEDGSGDGLDVLRAAQLAADGLADDTIIFYWADHGSGMPRSKRWPANSGLHVPLIVHIPEKFKDLRPADYVAGGTTDRAVSFVDFAPTMCSLAGVKPPEWMQGYAFLGKFIAPPQPYVYGFRGRMDERYDLVRSVTDGRYVYLRNYLPHLSQGQHVDTQFKTPTTAVWKKLYDEGTLNAGQSIFWQTPKFNMWEA